MNAYIQRVLDETRAKNANEPEFLQTVEEVLTSLEPVINAHPEYEAACLLERMVEPERTIEFRVVWMDDQLKYHVNRGYRVQYNAALGPYKGGLRFASNVNLSIIKFLGFEQTFKDALTCLPIGGAKGGSDFSPIGRSDGEVMRFCQAFMTEFHRHIGQDIDCPAGDVGVGGREVGYLYGQYRRIVGAAEFGAMSGKAVCTGGSILRPEATGFGAVYYLREVLKHDGKGIKGLRVAMSGYGNVGWGIMKKIDELGGKVTYFAGPDGYIHDPDGVCGKRSSTSSSRCALRILCTASPMPISSVLSSSRVRSAGASRTLTFTCPPLPRTMSTWSGPRRSPSPVFLTTSKSATCPPPTMLWPS